MEFIILGIVLWGASSALSYQIEKKTEEQFFQTIEEEGYRLNHRKWKEMKEMLGEKEYHGVCLENFIPIKNLIVAISHMQEQKKNKKGMLCKLQLFGVLEDKSTMELQEDNIQEEEDDIVKDGLYHQEDISCIVAIGGRKQTLESLREELLAHSMVRKEEPIKKVK